MTQPTNPTDQKNPSPSPAQPVKTAPPATAKPMVPPTKK
jgi:hypothetical protein